MSRLIVKNLPKAVSEQKLRSLFGQKGVITDVQLKYKNGIFRQFAFVGYESETSAQEAVNFFDNSFIGTSKIKTELCAALGDESKPKSWSKYASDSKTAKKKIERGDSLDVEKQHEHQIAKKSNADRIKEVIGEYKDDPQFKEFMESHATDKLVWQNDFGVESSETDVVKNEDRQPPIEGEKIANENISDADYMKQLMGTVDSKTIEKKEKTKGTLKLFTIKVRNIPKKTKREDLKKFFRPSKVHSVRIPKNSTYAYVGFKLERDMKRALTKDKSFLKGKQLHVYEFTQQNNEHEVKKENPRWQEQEEKLKGEESIIDSGKLFFRNLPYTVTEDDVQKEFEKYGSVVEVNVPIDSVTRKIKGFGTVTFLMPENAVKAYTELNGTMFHGRMFHILPGKANDNNLADESNSSNYKEKKKKDIKNAALSAHNWNTLFMGPNAVAEVMAKTYGKSKEEVLDSATGGTNAAVRLALGETQIVLDMKKFLESHGVRLEAFDDSAIKRSKTIILAKNLPSGTNVEELRTIFSAFGLLEKIILPPSGVTCLIKFADPGEARKAFKRLAYSKFKHTPLFLEWAPENVLKSKEEMESEGINEQPENIQPISNEESDDEPEPKSTLFIKNIDNSTTEETIRHAFSHIGPIHNIQIAKKKIANSSGEFEPLGYGFIQFKTQNAAEKALKVMQLKEIAGKTIELKRSDRTLSSQNHAVRKNVKNTKQKGSTKIMVRNIPFQANANEVRELFKTFGELKAVRLPKKSVPGPEQHRGFGFIDFVNKSDAKTAFEALHHSTHLYGRRLVLEWAETEEDVTEIRKRAAKDLTAGDGGHPTKKSRKGLLNEEELMSTSNMEEVDDE